MAIQTDIRSKGSAVNGGALRGLLAAAAADPFFTAIGETAGSITHRITGPASIRPFVAGVLAAPEIGAGVPVLLVTATGREAEAAVAAIGDLLGDDNVALFPSWETLPHERLSPRADTVGRRLATLRRLAHPELDPAGYPAVVVATIRSMIQPMAPHLGEMIPVTLEVGEEIDLTSLVEQLISLAYTRVDIVEKRGEVAVRGGILDVFPPTASHPVRIEFFGDEITDIRTFGVIDQRSLEAVGSVTAPPCREILLTTDVRDRAAVLAKTRTGDPTLAQMLDNLANGISVEGMESLIPVLVGEDLELLPNLVRPGHTRAARRPGTDPDQGRRPGPHRQRVPGGVLDGCGDRRQGADRPRFVGVPEPGGRPRRRPGRRTADLAGRAVRRRADGTGDAAAGPGAQTPPTSRPWSPPRLPRGAARRGVGRAGAAVGRRLHGDRGRRRGHRGTGRRAPGRIRPGRARRRGIAGARRAPMWSPWSPGRLENGFVLRDSGLAILTEADLTGTRGVNPDAAGARMPTRRRNAVDPVSLKPGDYVVHAQHGIGKYVDMVQRTSGGAIREYLVVEYAPSKRRPPR